MSISVDQEFKEERACIYDGREYRVRDNGAVMRLTHEGKRTTKNDNVWTFGEKDTAGYLSIAGIRVHLIVAKAFLGEKPQDELVIDHIDTIKTNNRPSNLHYVTRFENLVNNPLTRAKLEHATGLSIDKILEDLSVIHNLKLPPNLTWVKTVSQAEADSLRRKMEYLTSKPVLDKSIAEAKQSRTFYALQVAGWYPIGTFPCCPQHESSSLEEYASNLIKGEPVFVNPTHSYITEEYGISSDGKTLVIKCSDSEAEKKNILITITYHSKKWFIHKCDRYFGEDGLEKYYMIALGHEWQGGDVFDDYCM